jgi:hypothetical protein
MIMRFCVYGVLMGLLLCPGVSRAGDPGGADGVSCAQVSSTGPGYGVRYTGHVESSDYRMSLTIPKGRSGWGADFHAPFHGFVIYLDDARKACVVFEIHIRVDEAEIPERPKRSALIHLGSLPAWQLERRWDERGVPMVNIETGFTSTDGKAIHDGSLLLISPALTIPTTRPVYESILSSLRIESH